MVEKPDIGGQYYVATWGSDMNPGTFDKPWRTWQRAFSRAKAGDTVYFRGGIYYDDKDVAAVRHEPASSGNWGFNGTADNYIHFFNYPGEVPVLDGKNRTPAHWNTAMIFDGSAYIHLRGLTVRNFDQIVAADPATGISAWGVSNMIFEQIVVHNIGGPGIFYMSGLGYRQYPHIEYDTTIFLNCDFFNNEDPLEGSAGIGGKADGLWYGGGRGAFCIIDGCRAWNNSDGGFDTAGDATIVIRNSWAFLNIHEHGDGTGFKFGSPSSRNPVYGQIIRYVYNNIAAWNEWGFTENNRSVGGLNCHVFNNIAYDNEELGFIGFKHEYGDTMQNVYYNNISYVNRYYQDWLRNGVLFASDKVHGYEGSNNTWDHPSRRNPMYIDIQDSDFHGGLDSVTIVSQMTAPRKSDGSLPDITVFRLSEESIFKGNGTYVGMSQNPDIGVDWEYFDRTKGSTLLHLQKR